jgi:hypothetical protein
VAEELAFAVGASFEAGHPGGPVGNGGEEVEVVAHDAVGEELNSAEIGDAQEDTAEGLLFGVIEEDVTAAGARHDVVEVGLEGEWAEDAFSATGPATARRRIPGGFGVDGEEGVGVVRGLSFGGLRRFHGARLAKNGVRINN